VRIFDYRVRVFPEFQAWTASITEPAIYAFDDIDNRLIYYSNKPVRTLDDEAFERKLASQASMLLLVEAEQLTSLAPLAQCRVREFNPYLKKHKSLIVLGFSSACDTSSE